MSKKNPSDSPEKKIKIVIFGKNSSGKTSLPIRYCYNKFTLNEVHSSIQNLCLKSVEIEDNRMKLYIIKISSESSFVRTTLVCYQKVSCAIILFDKSSIDSFNVAKEIMLEISYNVQPHTIIVLAGNKCELEPEVTFEEGNELALEFGAVYIEISVKVPINVNLMFEVITRFFIST